MQKELILVDQNDKVVGFGEKMQVHQEGQLHRAFSLFVINSNNQLLLQKRAYSKYHSGGLWANTCCSHPLKGENIEETIHTRLMEEMGFDCELNPFFKFLYRVDLDNGLTEYEYDHVFLGRFEGAPDPNPEEVCDWKWMDIDDLKIDLEKNPSAYVYWIKAAFDQFYQTYVDQVKDPAFGIIKPKK
mgnify:CR=1 FL=1